MQTPTKQLMLSSTLMSHNNLVIINQIQYKKRAERVAPSTHAFSLRTTPIKRMVTNAIIMDITMDVQANLHP